MQVRIDRNTVAGVLKRLEERGLVKRRSGKQDLRQKLCSLTATGEEMLAFASARIECVHDRTVEGLTAGERRTFMLLLNRLVESNNDLGRAQLTFQ
jgi:DNA-binding MarR family transcriptional regulator